VAVPTDVLIRVEDLHRDFVMGDQVVWAVNGITTTVEAGEFLAVMGPSGSGKSTLLYLVGGLDRPTGGEIWVGGREIVGLDENALADYRRREIGFVFQSYFLVPTMTALQNVAFPMIFAHVSAAERESRARNLLTWVGLADRLRKRWGHSRRNCLVKSRQGAIRCVSATAAHSM
jgi:putative ABC transport system ATP-binding protein